MLSFKPVPMTFSIWLMTSPLASPSVPVPDSRLTVIADTAEA